MAGIIPLYSISSQSAIEQRARDLFELAGRPTGRDLDHWLQAEAEHLEHLLMNPVGPNSTEPCAPPT